MAHLRTKRKTATQKLNSIITSIFLIFISMYILIELGNFVKGKSENFKLTMQNSKAVVVKGMPEIQKTIKTVATNIVKPEKKNKEENIPAIHGEKFLITKDGDKIFVEIASTTETRNAGLSGRGQLSFYQDPEGKLFQEGMLFVFPEEITSAFWMKDMNYDLDIIWLDEDFEIVYIEKALASSYNQADPSSSLTFTNGDALAKYVLEISIDSTKRFNLKIGDRLKME